MRILGLPPWRGRLSDEQLIKRIRKDQRVSRWVIGLLIATALFVAAGLFWILVTLQHLPGSSGGQLQTVLNSATAVGIILGAFIGFYLSVMLHTIVKLLFVKRKNSLLLNCWDALHERLEAQEHNRY